MKTVKYNGPLERVKKTDSDGKQYIFDKSNKFTCECPDAFADALVSSTPSPFEIVSKN